MEIIEKGHKDYTTTLETIIKSLRTQLKEILHREEEKSTDRKSDLTIKKGEIYQEW